MLIVLTLAVTVFFLSILPAQVHALTPTQVFDKVKDSVVVVKNLDDQGKVQGQGSGVLIPSGKIATNCHVVEGGASFRVGRGKQLIPATLYAEDGDKDICILDVKGFKGKPAQIGEATSLKVGDPVYAVGAPQGLELSLSDGIVSQLRGGPPPLIQTTAAISPGSSGGGLFDREARLVGLTTLYIESGQSLNFAMPAEWIGEAKQGRKQFAGVRSQTEWRIYAAALTVTKNWELMLDWCLKWTKSEPDDAYAWYSLGTAYLDLNRDNDAIQAFHQSIRINPEDAGVWAILGIAYKGLNLYNDAIQAFRQSIRINPEDAGTWGMLGAAYNLLNRYDDAIDAFRQSIRINPENAGYWYNLGITYKYRTLDSLGGACQPIIGASAARQTACSKLKNDSYKDVIEAFRQAIRINPEYTQAWDNLGFTYTELSRYDDAIEAYRQAILIDPKYTDAWYNLAFTYALSGNRTAAMDVFRELRRLDPEKANKLFNLIVPR